MRPPRMIIAAAAGALVAIPGFAIAAPGGLDLLSNEPAAEALAADDTDCNDVPEDGTQDCVAAVDADTCDDSGETDNGVPDCAPPAPVCDDDPETTEIPDCEPEPVECDDDPETTEIPDCEPEPVECDDDPETTEIPDCEDEEVDCADEANVDLDECQDDDEGTDEDEDEDEGHGEAISALARCMPGGHQLHGLGFNKGFVISQAASTGEVTLPDAEEALAVTSPEEATAVCDAVDALMELADEEAAADGGAEDDRSKAKGRPDWAGPKSDDADQGEDTEETTGTTGTTTTEVQDEGRGGPPAHAGGKGKGGR